MKLQTWPFGEIESSLVQVQLKGLGKKLSISVKPGTHTELADAAEPPGRVTLPGMWGLRCPAAPRPCSRHPGALSSICREQPSERGEQGTSVPCEASAVPGKLCSTAAGSSRRRPGRERGRGSTRSPQQPPAIACGERTAQGSGQPNTLPAPEERERRQAVSPSYKLLAALIPGQQISIQGWWWNCAVTPHR